MQIEWMVIDTYVCSCFTDLKDVFIFFWHVGGLMNTGFNAQHMWNWCKTKGSILSFVFVCQLTVIHYRCYGHCSVSCSDVRTGKLNTITVQRINMETRITVIAFKFWLGQFIRIYFIFRLIVVYFHLLYRHLTHIDSSLGSCSNKLFPSEFFHFTFPNDVVILTDVKHDMRRGADTFSGDDAFCHSCCCE